MGDEGATEAPLFGWSTPGLFPLQGNGGTQNKSERSHRVVNPCFCSQGR
jgi:hypothetical protein